ncbi:MAG: segregation ATPase FtsK/SpoIIIE, family [Candidatus Atribacteria bacterium]|nr:segregation ATPase FtsK/SpoIIIE, family [Candidatus Atribacteria bacterium]
MTVNKLKVSVSSFLAIFSVYLFLALISLDMGVVGALLANFFLRLFGIGAYLLPFILIYLVFEINLFFFPRQFKSLSRIISVSIWFLIFLVLSQRSADQGGIALSTGYFGGIVGNFLYQELSYFVGEVGTILILFTLGFVGVFLAGEGKIIRKFYYCLERIFEEVASSLSTLFTSIPKRAKENPVNAVSEQEPPYLEEVMASFAKADGNLEQTSIPLDVEESDLVFSPPSPPQAKAKSRNSSFRKAKPAARGSGQWVLPDSQLLRFYPSKRKRKNDSEIAQNIEKLEKTLDEFHVSGRVVSVQVGPNITRYEFQPAPGIKVNKIVSLSNDIALAFAAAAVRIEAPIPGKAAVGIEIPNRHKEIVSLRELIEVKEFKEDPSPLMVALGKGVSGEPLFFDLKDMPHLLIAGATGSGKSVCINSILASLLYRSTPQNLRIGLVDPKRVELSVYSGLPHLCAPVISEVKWVVKFLKWACREMDNRYELLSEFSARNLEEYNQMVQPEERLPYLVIIIDELADLMMTASSQIETYICRLAQMARAVGIHLVIATQRPSVDVITGLIKANFPSRIAFAVSSQVDSKTILDGPGAEKLLGHGDLLFSPVGSTKSIRGQGAFVSTAETKKLVAFWASQEGEKYYSLEFVPQEESPLEFSAEEDELYQEAVSTVVKAGKASTSLLQRRLRIGFNRAARLIERMEQDGIVGPYEGGKARKVIVNREGK